MGVRRVRRPLGDVWCINEPLHMHVWLHVCVCVYVCVCVFVCVCV